MWRQGPTTVRRHDPRRTRSPAAPAADAGVATPAPTPAPPETLPGLRTGERVPEAQPAVVGTAAREFTDAAGAHYLEITFDGLVAEWMPSHAAVSSDDRAWTSTVVEGTNTRLLLRTSAPTLAAASVTGTLWSRADDRFEFAPFDAEPRWGARSFTVTGTPKRDPDLPRAFATAVASELRGRDGNARFATPFHSFAAGRIYAALLGDKAGAAAFAAATDVRRPSNDFAELMYTTTAETSLEEALVYDKGLLNADGAGKRDIPIADVTAPALADHPFATRRAGLPATAAATPEPLAAAAPAEYWYVRFDDIRDMLRVLDEADAWLTPVAHAFEERPLVRDLAQRYQRQLGLGRSGLARALGHTVISRVAIVGSDPYLREGSDVTFLFEVASQTAFETELSRHLADWSAKVPGIAKSELQHEGHTITVQQDEAGLVRQHRAQVGTIAVVSNSATACRRVLDAIDGRKPRLSDEPDLQYMLARDPGEHDAFAFLGDRFVGAVVGPAQKIQQARRMQALAELSVPGHAALLYGWLQGQAPADTAAMIAAGVLDEAELRHADGTAIQFTPGGAARSSYGTAEALTPLADLPAVTHVTAAERDAYQVFARGYQDYWRQFIDPIAVRLDLDEDHARFDVRVLPLIEGTNYRDVEQIVGKQRIEVPAIDGGVQAVWAVGRDTELRRDLDRLASSVTGKSDLGLGWLGDWVAVGTLDRAPLLELLASTDTRVQLPPPKLERDLQQRAFMQIAGRLPLFVAADVQNPASLVATLAAVRTLLNEVAPGTVTWDNVASYHDVPIVRVGVSSKAPDREMAELAEAVAIYYAQPGGSIVMALQQSTVEALIDRYTVDTGRPRGLAADGTQFAVEARLVPQRALWHGLAWLVQAQAMRGQPSARGFAEAILRGDPAATDPARFEALSRAYFGGVPVTPEGRSDFSLAPDGVRDPIHGSTVQPIFAALPMGAQTPLAQLLDRLAGVRATVAFDDEPARMEPPARSLHTTVELHLGAAAAD
ncbi:MAG: hypothetical protein U0168_20560 [Nannocystaceae bacterium]